MPYNPDKMASIAEEMLFEAERASTMHAAMNSLHEAYAVLLEEVDELWEEVKKNPRKHPECRVKAREEALQVGAMAMRLIHDVLS